MTYTLFDRGLETMMTISHASCKRQYTTSRELNVGSFSFEIFYLPL